MLKLIRWLLFLAGVVVIVVLAVDNRQPVTVGFWPLPYAVEVPLYWVLLAGLGAGVVLGGLASWLSRASNRSELRRLRRKVQVMEQQERAKREAEEQALVDEARRKTQAIALAPPPAGALAPPRPVTAAAA